MRPPEHLRGSDDCVECGLWSASRWVPDPDAPGMFMGFCSGDCQMINQRKRRIYAKMFEGREEVSQADLDWLTQVRTDRRPT